MKFEDYHINPKIKAQLTKLGLKRPTDIQFKAIQPILDGEDVFAIAQTGTGKTAAFVIPTLHMIQKEKKYTKGIKCLVMVPTRELAQQIGEVYQSIGKKTGINTLALFGGVEQENQISQIKDGIDVLVTTPGRMFDLIAQKVIDLSAIRFLVLDEADLMLDLGFLQDIKDVLRHLPRKRQSLFFSATISKKIKALAYKVGKDAIRIQISPNNPVSKNVTHAYMDVDMDDKRFFLENVVKENEESKILVFVRTQVRAERVTSAMERVGIEAVAMHGGIAQDDRFQILDRFRNETPSLLITTDVAARGIDIPNVECVVNYDIPENPENYVHRCGRTGRGNNRGVAISFCSDHEKELIESIQEYTGSEIEKYEISKGDYSQIKFDSEDITYDWKSLIDEENQRTGEDKEWRTK